MILFIFQLSPRAFYASFPMLLFHFSGYIKAVKHDQGSNQGEDNQHAYQNTMFSSGASSYQKTKLSPGASSLYSKTYVDLVPDSSHGVPDSSHKYSNVTENGKATSKYANVTVEG